MADALPDVTAQVRDRVTALGYDLWDVRTRGTARRVVLQVRIDRPEAKPGASITVDECAAVSRRLEAWLDDSGILGRRYVLEVSSPGMERPLRWPEHWARCAGRDVRVRVAGRGRFRATIVAVREPDSVVLRPAGTDETVTLPLSDVQEATLVVDWSEIDGLVSGS